LPALTEGLDLAEPGREEMTLLWFAIINRNFDAIRLLVELGAKPEEHVAQGLGTAVAYALHHKDTRFLQAMLDGGLSVDHKTALGTPLIQRAAGADGATIDHLTILVQRGAALETKDSLGETALVAAIDTHQPDRAMYLVEQGADVNTYNNYGATAMYAVHLRIERQQEGSALRKEYEKLRDMMIARGAKYPPEHPAQVREWMKSQGMKVIE
jgi:ankyrin repeat protein